MREVPCTYFCLRLGKAGSEGRIPAMVQTCLRLSKQSGLQSTTNAGAKVGELCCDVQWMHKTV